VPKPSSNSFIAAVAIATFGLTAGAAFAQSPSNGTHDRDAPSRTAASHRPASKQSVREVTAQVKKEVKEMKAANAKLARARRNLASTTRALHHERSKELRVASAERKVGKSERKESARAKPPRHQPPPKSNRPR
jgi:hypothetical protein